MLSAGKKLNLIILLIFVFSHDLIISQTYDYYYTVVGTRNYKGQTPSKKIAFFYPSQRINRFHKELKYSNLKSKLMDCQYNGLSIHYLKKGSSWFYDYHSLNGKSFIKEKQLQQLRKYGSLQRKTIFMSFGINYQTSESLEKEKKNSILEYKRQGYEVIEVNKAEQNSSAVSNTRVSFSDVKIDEGLYVSGYVTIKSKFVFFGYPYIVSEYQDLTVTNILIRDKMGFSVERFDAKNDVLGFNKVDFLPYKPRNKPLIDANFWIWTPKILNPNSERKEHYKVFNYPVHRIATITDNFGNKEVDAYFKAFNHSQKNDDYFWTNSILKNPNPSSMNTYTLSAIEIKNIHGSLSQDLKNEIQKFKNQNKIKKSFKNLTPSIKNAEISFNGGDFKSAIELLDKTVKRLGATNARIESLYAKSYFKVENYDKAKLHLFNYFDQANPNDKDYQNAKKLFKEVNDKIYDELRRKRGY